MAAPFFGQSFWQGVLANALVNLLWSAGIGTALLAFLKYVGRVVWQRRQALIGWTAFVAMIFLTLSAIRYNTVSAKESTIQSLQGAVEQLNREIAPRRISEDQRKCLVLALTEVPIGSVNMYANIGDGEAYRYLAGLVDPLMQAKWKANVKGSTPYPMPGLWILMNTANSVIPVEAQNLGRAFQKCGVQFTYRDDPNSILSTNEWALVVGSKPD